MSQQMSQQISQKWAYSLNGDLETIFSQIVFYCLVIDWQNDSVPFWPQTQQSYWIDKMDFIRQGVEETNVSPDSAFPSSVLYRKSEVGK